MIEPQVSALVVVPYVAHWRELTDPLGEAARLSECPADQLPRALRGYGEALAGLAEAVLRSGLLTGARPGGPHTPPPANRTTGPIGRTLPTRALPTRALPDRTMPTMPNQRVPNHAVTANTDAYPAVGSTGPHAAVTGTGPHAALIGTGAYPAVTGTGPHAALIGTGPHAAVSTTGPHTTVDRSLAPAATPGVR
jgi:hypothetical protein